MSINLQPLMQGALALLATVGSVAGPMALAAMERRLKMDKDTAGKAQLEQLASLAGGLAYTQLAKSLNGLNSPTTHNAALDAGVNFMIANAGPTLSAAGVDRQAVAEMVSGALGKLLAVDPSVSAGGTAATAVAVPTAKAGG